MDPTNVDSLNSLLSFLPESWEGKAMLIVTVCAVLASALPPPKKNSPALFKLVYNLINAIAFNFGRARNLNAPPKTPRQPKATKAAKEDKKGG